MSTPFRLLLPRSLYDEMIAQARAELPNECCGLIAGRMPNPIESSNLPDVFAVRRYPLVNEAASPTEYLSEPHSMFAAVRDMTREGLDIVAIYHSHPTSEPIPSRKDRERTYSSEVMNLIISLKGVEPEVRAWWLTPEHSQAADWVPVSAESS